MLLESPLFDHEAQGGALVDRRGGGADVAVCKHHGSLHLYPQRYPDVRGHGLVVLPVGGGLDDRAAVEPKDEARRGADVPGGGRVEREVGGADVLGVGRVDRETGGADVPGGGLVNRVAGGVWQHQARADPGGEGPILYPYSPSDILCFLCL